MKNEKQIVLFLAKNTDYNEVQLAARLNESFPDLGSPITIPFDEKNPGAPIIVFNKGKINLTMNYNDVSFIYNRENEKENDELMLEIVSFLEDVLRFVRLGYVTTYNHTKVERENFIENVFKDRKMITSEFQLSWYTSSLIDSVKVNVWERHLTDIMNKVEFVSIFDINTPIEEENNITSEFLSSFLKKCDKDIKDRMNDRF